MRRYRTDGVVSPEDLAAILGAAFRAPSAGWTQGVELLILTDEADRRRYWELCQDQQRPVDQWLAGMRQAPVLILIWTSETVYRQRYAEPDKGWPLETDRWSAPYWWVDAGMVVQNLLLAATARGVGSAMVGVPPAAQPRIQQAWGVPTHFQSVGLVTLGPPDADRSQVPVRAPRRARRADADRLHDHRWAHPWRPAKDR